MRELKKHQEMLARTQGNNSLKLNSYTPQIFGFTTTNSQTYQDFRLVPSNQDKAKKCAPLVHPVKTKALPGHFDTTNKKEMKKHDVKKRSTVDRIPYP